MLKLVKYFLNWNSLYNKRFHKYFKTNENNNNIDYCKKERCLIR